MKNDFKIKRRNYESVRFILALVSSICAISSGILTLFGENFHEKKSLSVIVDMSSSTITDSFPTFDKWYLIDLTQNCSGWVSSTFLPIVDSGTTSIVHDTNIAIRNKKISEKEILVTIENIDVKIRQLFLNNGIKNQNEISRKIYSIDSFLIGIDTFELSERMRIDSEYLATVVVKKLSSNTSRVLVQVNFNWSNLDSFFRYKALQPDNSIAVNDNATWRWKIKPVRSGSVEAEALITPIIIDKNYGKVTGGTIIVPRTINISAHFWYTITEFVSAHFEAIVIALLISAATAIGTYFAGFPKRIRTKIQAKREKRNSQNVGFASKSKSNTDF